MDYGDGTVIDLRHIGEVPKGVVSIWNKTPIYVCTNYGDENYEYTQKSKIVVLRTLPCFTDRYQNLVINGDLSYGDNTNLTSFGSYSDEGYLSKISNARWDPSMIDFIPINPERKYEISVDMKASNTDAKYYIGIMEYDVDQKIIYARHVMYFPNTLTELDRDLNPGDKIIYLKDLTNWNVNVSYAYQKAFIFWNYEDSTGYKYPELSYSQNRHSSTSALYENSAVNKTNNTITLTDNAGWPFGAYPKGTKVSQNSDSSTYNYSVMVGRTLTTNWNTYSANIKGVLNDGDVHKQYFRSGTRFVKFFGLMNDNNISNTTTYIKNISIKEVEE